MKKITVVSTNPVKVNAVKEGFQRAFPGEEFIFESISASSDVSEQPMSEEETYEGAVNRVDNAIKKIPTSDYYTGIEGGIEDRAGEMHAFAWIIIKSSDSSLGKARTSTFILPKKIRELILAGKELGQADDIVFGHENSKQKTGSVGILTNDVITRTSYYAEAVVLALIPFLKKELY